MTKGESKPNLGQLEEDDEFEEFPVEEWKQEETDQADLQVGSSCRECFWSLVTNSGPYSRKVVLSLVPYPKFLTIVYMVHRFRTNQFRLQICGYHYIWYLKESDCPRINIS